MHRTSIDILDSLFCCWNGCRFTSGRKETWTSQRPVWTVLRKLSPKICKRYSILWDSWPSLDCWYHYPEPLILASTSSWIFKTCFNSCITRIVIGFQVNCLIIFYICSGTKHLNQLFTVKFKVPYNCMWFNCKLLFDPLQPCSCYMLSWRRSLDWRGMPWQYMTGPHKLYSQNNNMR